MENIEKKIITMIQDSNKLYKEKGLESALEKLLEAWDIIPEPKVEDNMATVLADFIAKNYLVQKQYSKALYWGDVLKKAQTYKIDSGEGFLFCGKVYYETGEKEKAIEEFVVAWKKSKGRAFRDESPEYLALIKNIIK